MTAFLITFFAVLAVGGWGIALLLSRALSRRDRAEAAHADLVREIADIDPGPLDDEKFRVLLGRGLKIGKHKYAFIPSRTLDRMQDAFERLLREKRSSKARWLS